MLTFNEQVCLAVVDKLLVALGVIAGAYYVAKRVEAFKREQDVVAEVRKRQYDAMLRLLEAVGKLEHAAWLIAGTRGRFPEHFEAATGQYVESTAVINQNAYLVGFDLASKAFDVTSLLLKFCQEFQAAVAKGPDADPAGTPLSDKYHQEFRRQLNRAREPLMGLLPPLPEPRTLPPVQDSLAR